MVVSEERLKAAIKYGKLEDVVESDQEEKLLAECIYAAAVTYFSNTGISEPEKDAELYFLAVNMLFLYWYDHRDLIGNEAALPVGLRPIINQLKQIGELTAAAAT